MKRALALVSIAVLVAACTSAAGPSGAAPSSSPSIVARATTSPTAIATSPRPTPLPAGPDIELAGLLDPLHGWVILDRRLLVTADGGSTWHDMTPPGAFATATAGALLGVTFFDARHGWVAINEAFTSPSDASYGRVDIWRTSDGGQSWTKTQLPKARFAVFGEIMPGVQFDFLDADHGFVFQSGNLAKGANDSDLFWTADGGATWSADRPTGTGSEGIEGNVAFASASDGVIVNAWHSPGIVVTRDGGRTWAPAAFPVPSDSAGAQPIFGQPAIFDGHTGLVAVDFQDSSSATVSHVSRIYRTTDAGSSWSIAATLPGGGIWSVAFLDQQRWIGSDGKTLVVTGNGGATWTSGPAVGLPGSPLLLQMASAQVGWALVWMSVCLDFKSNCASRTGLYATGDGGATWGQLWPK